jgi:hypothetical protein
MARGVPSKPMVVPPIVGVVVFPNPPDLAGVAVVSENRGFMELVSVLLTVWVSGGMILSVFWLLSLE